MQCLCFWRGHYECESLFSADTCGNGVRHETSSVLGNYCSLRCPPDPLYILARTSASSPLSFSPGTQRMMPLQDRGCAWKMRKMHACFIFNTSQTGKSRKDTPVKQTLLSIKRTTDVTTYAIAERSRLPLADVFVVETGGFCSGETARQVLMAFNQLRGMHLSLEDISIHHTHMPPAEQSFNRPARKDVHKIAPVKVVSMNTRGPCQGGRP